MKIILDCNVIIAAGLTDGVCRQVIFKIIKNHKNYVSEEILKEYIAVINRDKFKKHQSYLQKLLKIICEVLELAQVSTTSHRFELPDIDDEKYLALACSVKADYLITGNLKHFPDKKYIYTKVISPGEFLAL
ncbi:hypothetical protein NF27_DC00040 [Candidatus Jidaibacter acanthamoeba]|uniref:PIN domain-containing protein n=1 Tax=Candidatus Jidaibacter acanthamoebae TaxID=86105 RepID=A0A0C1R097_9RICK|nr:putative toxin-antitoxin system toxin component, PIN family [Candidatus Jidaibacter acanthamoeba]KIE05725.1 hypothetical protein NF27_DC00040 [Candidatus Jidaibacter acanthamoeba]